MYDNDILWGKSLELISTSSSTQEISVEVYIHETFDNSWENRDL